ncbi:uncharacterized protein LOC131166481 [Malania oleifera]|uniref:uncharacterized protein LOC131166481 n=1 Tax=Malania oleifera TaxID=397392 RepID=UPI0025AE8FAB|nr:uncharacterized protein LOC131166481 [Malania oleifera]
MTQGLVVDGGGERKGIPGIVGIVVGIVGIVVGMFVGIEGSPVVAGNGGNVTFGSVVGSVGSAVGIFGKGGITTVGLGRVGAVGNVGSAVGNGGNVAFGSVGIAGNGGIAPGFRRDGIVGSVGAGGGAAAGSGVSSRRRAAKLVSMPNIDNVMIKVRMRHCLEVAIV